MPRQIEELVNEQVRRSEIAGRKWVQAGERPPGPVVTISRRMGTGARVVAEKLAHDLGYSLWDRELVDAIATDAHVSRRIVEAFDEHTMSEIEVLVRAGLGDMELGDFIYPIHLARAVAAISKLGNAIILGRGANFLLPAALHVRIDATDERRISNMMRYEGLSREQAIARLRESDASREQFLVSVYGRERVRHAFYDLVIWTDRFSVDDAAEIIKTAIHVRFKG